MSYSLGNVRPYVARIANKIGPMFGITTAYGYSYRNIAGTSTLSDHARGLAVDFMVYSDSNKGDALASYVKQNAATLDVTYIIWNHHIWSVARAADGWRTYSGVNPHTDHVHVSFKDLGTGSASSVGLDLTPWDGVLPSVPPWLGGGSDGKPGIPDPLQDGAGALAQGVQNIGKSFQAVGKIVQLLLNPHTWVRYFMFLIGLWLVGIAIYMLIKDTKPAQAAAQGVKTAAKTARKVKANAS